jgi:mRNA interferase MazF
MKRGEIYWADLAPRSGSEQTGRRPVIVVSHDGFNQAPAWRSTIVVPISTSASQGKRGLTVVEIPGGVAGLPKTSFAVCHQVTTLDAPSSPSGSVLCRPSSSDLWNRD